MKTPGHRGGGISAREKRTSQRIPLNRALSKRQVAKGKKKRKLPRSMAMSPGSFPSQGKAGIASQTGPWRRSPAQWQRVPKRGGSSRVLLCCYFLSPRSDWEDEKISAKHGDIYNPSLDLTSNLRSPELNP